MRKVSLYVIVMLISLFLSSFIVGASSPVGAGLRNQPATLPSATTTVPDDYPTIQEAINKATIGDTIFVRSGVYSEAIVVNKTISLIGQDEKTTIIDAGGEINSVAITSDNVTFSGFTMLSDSSIGIDLASSNCFLSGNTVYGSPAEGIFLNGSTGAEVYGNTLEDNAIMNSEDCGILVWGADNNYIKNNTVKNCYFGIFLYLEASLNRIEQNIISDIPDAGIILDFCGPDNVVVRNDISNCGLSGGIFDAGIVLNFCSDNQIISNYISNSQISIFNSGTNGNLIYHNSFIDNNIQTDHISLSSDIWDNGCEGNYWSNYNGSDLDNDGVGDTYLPWEAVDNFPLINVYWSSCDINHDLKVDFRDIGRSAKAFGTVPGDTWWIPHADITGPDGVPDGKVDMRDISLIANHFGERYP
jgi:nitrous oxidase accessory protein